MNVKKLGAVSAYKIAVEHGYTGTEEEWLNSLHGKDYVLTQADRNEIAGKVTSVAVQNTEPSADANAVAWINPDSAKTVRLLTDEDLDPVAIKQDLSTLDNRVSSYTKQSSKQLFDKWHPDIIRGLTNGTGNKFVSTPKHTIIPIAVANLDGQRVSYNVINNKSYADLGISSISLIASQSYPAVGVNWITDSSDSASNKRGAMSSVPSGTAFLSLRIITSVDAVNYNFAELFDSVVVRKGDYNTTYYPYDLIDVQMDNLSDEIKLKLEEADNTDAVRLHNEVKFKVGNSIALANEYTIPADTDISVTNSTEVGASYLVEWDCATTPAEDTLFVSIGSLTKIDTYNGNTHNIVGIVSDGGAVKFNAKSSFRISNLTVRKIQDDGEEVSVVIQNIDGNCLDNNLTGFWNVAIGLQNQTMAGLKSGSRNIGVGKSALGSLVSGTRNVGIGTFALYRPTSGDRNIAIGADAMWQTNNNPHDNVAIGKGAIDRPTSPIENSAIGNGALANKDTANRNVAVGYNAVSGSSSATNCVAVGHTAGYYSTNGNTCVGYRSGYFSRGNFNTTIGHSADIGSGQNSYTESIAIGHNAVATKSNQMVLGSSAVTEMVVMGNKKLIFNADGTVKWEQI